MDYNKNTWVFVGVFLWGLPTGILFSVILGFTKSGTLFEFGGFNINRFWQVSRVLIPLFFFLGWSMGLGIEWLGKKRKQLPKSSTDQY